MPGQAKEKAESQLKPVEKPKKDGRPSPGNLIDGSPLIVFEQILRVKNGVEEYVYARSDDPELLEPSLTNYETGEKWKPLPKWAIAWPPCPLPESYRDEQYLFAAVRAWLERYVELKDPRYYDVLSAYVLCTWLMEDWRAIGVLYAVGPYNSGKTTLLECLEQLCFRGVLAGDMSPPIIFRLSHKYHPTILADEAQIYGEDDRSEMRAIINARYRKGSKIWRAVKLGNDWQPRPFDVYGPTAFASVEPPWEALASRALVLQMSKNTAQLEGKTQTDLFYVEAYRLRAWLLQYRFDKLLNYRKERGMDPAPGPIEEKLNGRIRDGRTREIGLPLLVVSPQDAYEPILTYLEDLEVQQVADEQTGEYAAYVQALATCLEPDEQGRVASSRVREELFFVLQLEDRKHLPSLKRVTRTLKSLGCRPVQIREGKKVFRGVEVTKPLLERLKARYVPYTPESGTSAESATPESEPRSTVAGVPDVPGLRDDDGLRGR